ncbi:class I SAM-dependent methyltransferase [Brevibacillus ginsengisoli]|uniref:class I SAM-dependent methyltransferase n=1 Tax=Brevibacillus ginsengisoli TaxID=363854 RepID=UPI003CF1F729
MIITTGLDPSVSTLEHAKRLAEQFGLPIVERKDASLAALRRKYQVEKILVVSSKGARIEQPQGQSFFFHPNTAAFRIKRLERGDTDTMLSACQIQPGDSVLDATLGLGADAIVFAYAVGPTGQVVGLESERIIALLVADGLTHWESAESLQQAMGRIQVVASDHLDYLSALPDRSFDVVYFDPMFEHAVGESTGISGLREFANHAPLLEQAIQQALRVARKRVVLKEGKAGKLFERYDFLPYRNREHHVVYSYREV